MVQAVDVAACAFRLRFDMWLRIDDNQHENAKFDGLSDAAYRLWSMAGCWCRKSENLWTEGFVPVSAIGTIVRGKWPMKRVLKLAEELVAAKGASKSGSGLWEPREGGWKFHDWEQYQPPKTVLSASDAARIAGKRSAEVRKARYGTAQPRPLSERDPNAFEKRSTEPVHRTKTERLEPPNPIPKLINLRSLIQELPGTQDQAREGRRFTAEELDAELAKHPRAVTGG